MLFKAPGLCRMRKRKFACSFCLNVLFLLHVFGTGFHGVLLAEEKALLEFTDNDPRGGWLSGDLIFTVPDRGSSPEKSPQISKFVLHWGNNPHQRLGMFLPIATLPARETGIRMRIQFKSTRVPPGATRFLLYSRNENEEEREVFSLTLIDKGVPNSKPQDIDFEQTGKEGNRVQGEIRVTRAWDERDLSHYAVYWGEDHETVLRTQPPVTVIEKKSWFGSLASQLHAPWKLNTLNEEIDILLPPEATHLIVFSRNAEGQMNEGVSVELEGAQAKDKRQSQKMLLHKKSAPSGIIAGEVILVRSENETDSRHYLFFWGKDKKTRLEDLPPLTQFEVKKIQDGLTVKEIQVSTLTMMDQKLQVSPVEDAGRELKYEFPPNTFIPEGATYILAFTQQKFWFQDDAERRLKGPVASVSIEDPEGKKQKVKTINNIKAGLQNFSIAQFNKKGVKTEGGKENLKSLIQEKETRKEKIRKAPEWRISEYRGLGLGLSFSGLNGIVTFYDYNLDDNQQLHYSLELTGPQVGSTFQALRLTEESTDMQSITKSGSGNSLEINRTLFSATYRWFVDDSTIWGITEGFFYGAGGGLGYATLKYQGRDTSASASISDDTETFNSTATVYSHSTKAIGLFAVLDAGWQGLENYFFQIAIQPSIYFYYKDGFVETSIPVNPNQRSTVIDRWSRAKNLTRLMLGFGIFF
ncbi:MAG TPA: hypothetical protein EYM80_05465 [Deltaproteobacteria bacterium]|nr:hypothetical protein [Deltaproteobacteria bacterium]